MSNIVLVGFMAAGKSAVGRALADRLGWGFVDFDAEIRDRTGRSAAEWIRSEGEPAFRALEAGLTDELAGRPRVVLAPGGGWGARPELAARLGPETVRVWLRVSPEEAVRRARQDGADRPLLGSEPDVDRALALLAEREPHYAASEVVVDVDGRSVSHVVDEIVRALGIEAGG